MSNVLLLDNHLHYFEDPFSLISVLGFEERAGASLFKFKRFNIKPSEIILLDYKNTILNEPMRSNTINIANEVCSTVRTISVNLDSDEPFSNLSFKFNVAVDISGMSRHLIFEILYYLDILNARYFIIYTEAESYHPEKKLYDSLYPSYKNGEIFFLDLLNNMEDESIIYSKNYKILIPKHFSGRPETSRPPVLISFLAFKRSRLMAILNSFEFSRRIFIRSKPVREDLSWRYDLQTVINFDILDSRSSDIHNLSTLDPVLTFIELEKIISIVHPGTNVSVYDIFNIYFSPLGSKMQTVGSYYFWKKFNDITLVFSQPNQYYPDKFSKGFRDSFLFDPILFPYFFQSQEYIA